MYTQFQTKNTQGSQTGAVRTSPPGKIILIFLISFAFAATSCHMETYPTSPADRNDVDLWKSARLDQSEGALFVAALRPDGISRLYNGTSEYSYANNSWSKTSIDSGNSNFMLTEVGRCRNDGILRMYGLSGTVVYEFNYTNNRWTKQVIATVSNAYIFVVGDPRNDGFESLYVYSLNGLVEIRDLGSWQNTLVNSNTDMVLFSGGDGRGDGKGGIYLMDRSTFVYELRYENSSWKRTTMGRTDSLPANTVPAYSALSVTRSHNGQPNVIVSTGPIYEFHFETDHWTKVQLGSEPGVNQIVDGIGRNDGIVRLYCAENFDIMAEYTFAGGAWAKTSQRKTGEPSAISRIVVGPARGDAINRIYVSLFISGIYEFSFIQ